MPIAQPWFLYPRRANTQLDCHGWVFLSAWVLFPSGLSWVGFSFSAGAILIWVVLSGFFSQHGSNSHLGCPGWVFLSAWVQFSSGLPWVVSFFLLIQRGGNFGRKIFVLSLPNAAINQNFKLPF